MYVQYRLAATLCCADMKLLCVFLKVINPQEVWSSLVLFYNKFIIIFSIKKKNCDFSNLN